MGDDEVLLEQVRQLRALGSSPKEIARTLRVAPAKVAPLIRAIAKQDGEQRPRMDDVECYISPGWHEGLTFDSQHPEWPITSSFPDGAGGLVTVLVTRRGPRKFRSSACVYLVDTFCLGVKNVIGPQEVSGAARNNLRFTVFTAYNEPGMHAPLELAQHLVFGAVDFARELGFEPHPDFAAATDHLGQRSGQPCPIQFGCNGAPLYIQGPDDDVESIAQTLARQPSS